MQTILELQPPGPGLHEFTVQVVEFVQRSNCREGLLTLFVQHTSCGLLVQENADPAVRHDLEQFLHRLVPPANDASMRWITHGAEGPDDMPAHIKAALTPVSLCIPVSDGRPALGTWQGIFLFEYRQRPPARRVVAQLTPTPA
ncbi:MAG: secondary thiamine-phosphate synthase enzyme YjbQ [Steroidobacteraceae bacterium]